MSAHVARRRGKPCRGFTTIELLIASSLLLIVTGAIAALATPMRDGVERSLGRADLTGASRFAIERLASELREAGSPATVAAPGTRLRDLLPSVVALADLDSGAPQSPGGAIQIASVPAAAPQGLLAATASAGTVFLELDLAARCTTVGLACGFRTGASAVLFDSSHFAIVTIHSVADAGLVRVTSPIPSAFPVGAVLTTLTITSYGLRPGADGSMRLVRRRQGSDAPLLDDVVGFVAETVGPDAFNVTKLNLSVRLEAASAAMRGPAGYLFRRAGSTTRARQWVPDVELRATIALRQGTA
jgi:hypothetical protein